MQKTYTQQPRHVKRGACYILRINGSPLRVRATHAAVIELVRVLLGAAPATVLEARA